MRHTIIIATLLVLTACARTSVMQVSQNELVLTTSAAPICGTTGSQQVAQSMAAIETLRRGYARYVIVTAGSQNNVSVVQTGPTYAQTYGSATVSGNTAYGSSTTYYGGQQTIVTGSHDTAVRIAMLNPGDPGYDRGVDAKLVLGTDWAEKVADGISTC
jgi:hypothetical protein